MAITIRPTDRLITTQRVHAGRARYATQCAVCQSPLHPKEDIVPYGEHAICAECARKHNAAIPVKKSRKKRERNPVSVKTVAKIVSAPVAGGAYPKGHKGATLWHAVKLSGNRPVQVLCKRVSLDSILDDGALYNNEPVSCPQCVAAVKRLAK